MSSALQRESSGPPRVTFIPDEVKMLMDLIVNQDGISTKKRISLGVTCPKPGESKVPYITVVKTTTKRFILRLSIV